MGNVIIFKIEDTLGMFNNSSSIRSKEVFDGLRETILAQESARLATLELGMTTIGRQEVGFNGFGFIGVADCIRMLIRSRTCFSEEGLKSKN